MILQGSMYQLDMCPTALQIVELKFKSVMKYLLILVSLYTLISIPVLVNAALPVAVDGQQLPTLAPMLEKVQKSIVSISTCLLYTSPSPRDRG